jgi:hypothetical protein
MYGNFDGNFSSSFCSLLDRAAFRQAPASNSRVSLRGHVKTKNCWSMQDTPTACQQTASRSSIEKFFGQTPAVLAVVGSVFHPDRGHPRDLQILVLMVPSWKYHCVSYTSQKVGRSFFSQG